MREQGAPLTVGRPRITTSTALLALVLGTTAAAPYSGQVWVTGLASFLGLAQAGAAGARVRLPLTFTLVLTWLGLTVIWSVAPSLTARGLVLTQLVGPRGALHALMLALKAVLVLSWLLYLAVPTIGRTQDVYRPGSFEGVFVQRNVAAFVAVIAFLTFAMAAMANEHRRVYPRAGAWAGLSLVTLLAAQSGTGLAVLLVSTAVAMTLVAARRCPRPARAGILVTLVTALCGLGAWLPFNLGQVSVLFGRDETLTGRTVIWGVIRPYVDEQPWIGYGWSALWTNGVSVTQHMWARAGFPFGHAHSSYLDFLVQTGIVGLALVLLLFASVIRQSLRLALTSSDALASWPAAVAICLLFYGIDEQGFASPFGWLTLITALALLREWTPVDVDPAVHLDEPPPTPRRSPDGLRPLPTRDSGRPGVSKARADAPSSVHHRRGSNQSGAHQWN
jgi:exopolysaccharide production protein ExoQ